MTVGKAKKDPVTTTSACLMLLAVMLSFAVETQWAQTTEEIDAGVSACLYRFYSDIKGGREMVAMAEGTLVLPAAIQPDRQTGGKYDAGALRVDGKVVSYYSFDSATARSPLGDDAKDVVILFMTVQALKNFQDSKNWVVGVDGTVTVPNFDAREELGLIKMNEPVIGIVFDAEGFIGYISLKGAKLIRIEPE